MTKKEKTTFLSRYGCLERSIERRLCEMEHLQGLAERILPPRGHRQGCSSAAEEIIRLNKEINEDILQLLALRQAIVTAITDVPISVCRLLLEYRYLDGCTWEQIAEKLSYSTMQVHRIHARALEQLTCAEAV